MIGRIRAGAAPQQKPQHIHMPAPSGTHQSRGTIIIRRINVQPAPSKKMRRCHMPVFCRAHQCRAARIIHHANICATLQQQFQRRYMPAARCVQQRRPFQRRRGGVNIGAML